MANSTLRKIAGLNKIGLPKTREAFLADFDTTDVDSLAGLQQAFEGLAEDNPEAYSLWMAASRNAGSPSDIIDNLANSLYQDTEVKGIRGKQPAVNETIESGMPIVETPEEKATLPDPPKARKNGKPAAEEESLDTARKSQAFQAEREAAMAAASEPRGARKAAAKKELEEAQAARAGEKTAAAASPAPAAPEKPARKASVSPASRKYASDLGVDISTVTGTGKNGAITKADIEKAARAGEKTAGAAPGPAAATPSPAPAQAAAPAPVADDLSDLPVPGGMGVTQKDLEADPAEVIPGAMGLTRDDVRNYLGMGGMLGDPVDAASAPMTMGAPMPSAPSPAAPALTADDMIALIDSMTPYTTPTPDASSPAGVDLSNLLNAASDAPATDSQFVPRSTPQYTPPTQVSTYDVSQPVGKMDPVVANDPATEPPWSPVTSRSDKFLEAMGLGGMAAGARYLTKPADFAIRNAIPLGAAAAATYGAGQYFGGGPSAPPPELINDLEMQSEQALQNAERGFSTFGAPPKQQMQMPPERPRGRSL